MTFNQLVLNVIHDASRRLSKIEVGYIPTEWFLGEDWEFLCAHPETHYEDSTLLMAGNYSGPSEASVQVEVCNDCDETMEDF